MNLSTPGRFILYVNSTLGLTKVHCVRVIVTGNTDQQPDPQAKEKQTYTQANTVSYHYNEKKYFEHNNLPFKLFRKKNFYINHK